MYDNILSYALPSYGIVKYIKNKTNKQNIEPNNINKQSTSQDKGLKLFVYTLIVGYILTFLLFIYVFYLSYKCNTACTPQMSIIEKILRGGLAVFLTPFYLIVYFLKWSDECGKCK
jgi:hypothetical protein